MAHPEDGTSLRPDALAENQTSSADIVWSRQGRGS